MGVTRARGSTPERLLAIDGGNSKTDVLLLADDGTVLGSARGPHFHPHVDGAEYAVASIEPVVKDLLAGQGLSCVRHVAACLANADLPPEVKCLVAAITARGWAETVSVANDTLAVLRAGSPSGWGVAVVCGAGINCTGVAPDGRTARFPALGHITGDWGGGLALAEEAMWWAVRSEDGRGSSTALAPAAARHFGLRSATLVAEAIHLGQLPASRLHELVPLLFAVAEMGDGAARQIVRRQAEEIVTLVSTSIRRLELVGVPTDVVLGGGVLAAGHRLLLDEIEAGLAESVPLARPAVLAAPPVVGAALLGLDHLAGPGSTAEGAAEQRVRAWSGSGA